MLIFAAAGGASTDTDWHTLYADLAVAELTGAGTNNRPNTPTDADR